MAKLSTYPDLDTAALDGTERLTGWRTTAPKNFGVPLDFVPISAVAISSPIPYHTFTLPNGYDDFALRWDNLELSEVDDFAAIFSFDSGVTWANDLVNTDTYSLFGDQVVSSGGAASSSAFGGSLWDSVASLGNGNNSFSALSWGTALIWPGNASRRPRINVQCEMFDDVSDSIRLVRSSVFFAKDATVPTTPARALTLRVGPRGNSDLSVTTPTSGRTIIGGSLHLSGLPSP